MGSKGLSKLPGTKTKLSKVKFGAVCVLGQGTAPVWNGQMCSRIHTVLNPLPCLFLGIA